MADGSITIDTKVDNNGIKSGLSKIGSIAGTALKGATIAIGAVATAFTGLVVASVNARGELEQQIGGVETLFKNKLGDASQEVIKNANNAYKTAGMSAIEYMQTATSFSASLLQSLGGDTKKAAEVTDMAITDMSDNANKMGTSMDAIQNAYQGFAKKNYTMLDNLKLGYGGTKTEMERLLADAQKLTGVKYDISNLSDVYNAVHAVQEELGITGTTALEASETLQGSFASMKASFDNFLSGSGDLSQVVDTVTDVVKNIVRIVNEAIPDIIDNIVSALPELISLGEELLNNIITGIITYLPQLMDSAGQILDTLIEGILKVLPQLIPVTLQVVKQLVLGIITYLPQILQAGVTILIEMIKGITEMLPELIPLMVGCILLIVDTLLDNIDLIIDTGIELLLALTMGIIEALPELVDKAPVIINKLLDAFLRNLPKIVAMGVEIIIMLIAGIINAVPSLIKQIPNIIMALLKAFSLSFTGMTAVGKGIVEGLWQGISNSYIWIKNKITGWVGNVTNFIKKLFGINSPSTVMRDKIGIFLAPRNSRRLGRKCR